MHPRSSRFFRILATLLFCLLPLAGQAEPAANKPPADPEKLKALLEKLETATEQRKQQNAEVDQMSQKLECNWTLIRAYENCGKLYQDKPDEHLQCSNIAKQNAKRCLEKIGEK